jgi:hypothetical protein
MEMCGRLDPVRLYPLYRRLSGPVSRSRRCMKGRRTLHCQESNPDPLAMQIMTIIGFCQTHPIVHSWNYQLQAPPVLTPVPTVKEVAVPRDKVLCTRYCHYNNSDIRCRCWATTDKQLAVHLPLLSGGG